MSTTTTLADRPETARPNPDETILEPVSGPEAPADAPPEPPDDVQWTTSSGPRGLRRPNPWPWITVWVIVICLTVGMCVAMATGVYTHDNTLSPRERAAIARAAQPR